MADLSAQLVRGKQAAFQYKPIVSEDLSWLARTENQRNYLESQAKQKEQQDLRDQLTKIQQLGLPKEMQGYLNSQVDDLIGKVRAGEIDPQSYDFRSAIAGIGGEANQLNNINTNLKTLAAEDKQVIGFDDLGAKDFAPELKNQYFGAFTTDYVPGTDVMGKFSGIQAALQQGTAAIKFDPTKLDTALKNFLDRNKELSAAASKMPGVTGLALIKELTSVDPDAVNKWNTFVDEAYGVDITSSYAADRRIAGDKAIGSQEDYARTRTNPWKIDAEKRVTAIETKTIPQPKTSATEGSLAGIFSQPVSYSLPEYGADSPPTETIATTLNLSKESTLDYQDPNTGEMLRGQPTKINRLFYDPQTQQYILGFNRYKKADGQTLPEGAIIIDSIFGGDKEKFYLDKSEELYQRANENDLNFDALVSTIMAETKTTRPQVLARLQAIKEAASATQSTIPQKIRSGDIEVDTSGTVLYNNKQITFDDVLKMSNNDKDRAVRFWSQRVPKDRVRKLDEPATKVYEFDENGKLIK